MTKKKISGFEFAIMEVADPEEAKNNEPFTKEEEINLRKESLLKTAKDLKIIKMDSKQEAIQKAYGEHWETIKLYVDENGWLNGNSQSNENGYIWNQMYDICEIGHNKIRPKSLSGIENNNGWIKIESEDDLPKETDTYFFIGRITCKIMKDYFTADSKVNGFNNCQFNLYSHYQPIQKPKPPIY